MSDRDPREPTGPVVRDKRRVDPVTGQVREVTDKPVASPPAGGLPPSATTPPAGDEVSKLEAQLQERTDDVQRVSAEYANYRKRVERDRDVARENATASVLADLLTVFDDIDRARDHGEVVGGFKSVADGLEMRLSKIGLQRYGERGEPFDPTVHEALTHAVSADVSETTCVDVFQPGYRYAGRVLRPARVAVADPPTAP